MKSIRWYIALLRIGLVLSFAGAGCGLAGEVTLSPSAAPITPAVTAPSTLLSTTPAATPTDPPTPIATVTPSPTPEPTVTPTPDPYTGLGVLDLASRSYGGGELQVHETMAVNSYFTRTLVSYPSDGLNIYGFMNTPVQGEPPYPVIIALHGYIDPAIYGTLDYTTRYADSLARAGYLVLHPNLRGYPPSDDGDNRFRVGMAVDVLNLIAIVQDMAGQPGPLALADPDAIGLWGHSMGGGIATRVLTVSPDVDAAVLYGAMSADDQQNFERIFSYFSPGTRGLEELAAPPEAFERISPIFYLDRIGAAVSIHHGKNDVDVPLAWSIDLCGRLQTLEKTVECYTYENQPHTFHGEGDELFMQQVIEFFNRRLKPSSPS